MELNGFLFSLFKTYKNYLIKLISMRTVHAEACGVTRILPLERYVALALMQEPQIKLHLSLSMDGGERLMFLNQMFWFDLLRL